MGGVYNYVEAARVVNELHVGFDAGLVRPGAQDHVPPIQVSEGFFFEPVVQGAYNPRLPRATEVEGSNVKNVTKIKKLCMDYRRSGIVGAIDSRSVAWIDAGGAFQTGEDHNYDVYQADMNLWDAIFALNPHILVELYYHLDTCGGGNFYTNGGVAKARNSGHEAEFVEPYVNKYATQVRSLRRKGAVELSKMW